MGASSKRKGKAGELEVAKLCREHGFPNAVRGRQHRGGPDSPDIVGVPGLHIEVKMQRTMAALYPALEQAQREAPEGVLPAVAYRQVRKGTGPGGARPWFIAIDAVAFLELWGRVLKERAYLQDLFAFRPGWGPTCLTPGRPEE